MTIGIIGAMEEEVTLLKESMNVVTTRNVIGCDFFVGYTKLNVLIENRQTVIAMLDRGKSIGDICRHFGLSRDTFAKFRMKYL